MIHTIRTSKFSKVIASYLAIQLILTTVQPSQLFALTGGPSQPEFNSFTPIGTSDMVDLASGDFNYNIPIMDVGGYPLNLTYNSGVTMDQEASWVGLGWNLNVGQIARQVRGIPDDFKGDEIRYENDMEGNRTIGTNFNINTAVFGNDRLGGGISLGLGVQYNNYNGISFKPSFGTSFSIGDELKANVGISITGSTTEGATATPSIGLSRKAKSDNERFTNTASSNFGVSFNSRKGLENMSLSFSGQRLKKVHRTIKDGGDYDGLKASGSTTGSISFNDQSYTPSKRAGLISENFTFSAGIGGEVFGAEVDGRVTGYGSYQEIRPEEKDKREPAFGYEHTEANEGLNGILDFNRENDRAFNENTTVLPVTNYTYDIYAIQGQGAGGQFRPFRSQTSYIYDQKVTDYGNGVNLGAEVGLGNLVHVGVDVMVNPSISYTGKWENNNYARAKFIETETDNNPVDYEPVYFATIGELGLDPEPEIYTNQLYTNQAIKIGLGGHKTTSNFIVKKYTGDVNNDPIIYENKPITNTKIKRTQRLNRNQSIQKITKSEAKYDAFVDDRDGDAFVKNHHTAGIKVLKPDGSTYVFGKTAYNTKKVEATFDMSGSNNINCTTGIIRDLGPINKPTHKAPGSDGFLNRVTTYGYAHTYLINNVLSSDYEDISLDGPTDDDLGAYTKFTYETSDSNFKWRVPYNADEASYNEGLKSKNNDQKGNYIYGEKELVYVKTIETKTHVAYFKLKNREDGRGAKGEVGEVSTAGFQKAIDKIYLFSKPEYENFRTSLENGISGDDPSHETLVNKAIKVAHFVYDKNDDNQDDYDLCQGIPNNFNSIGNNGKLTLHKVYFTYRGSNMGMYTPYVFHYDNPNPIYNLKGYDVWGNYKKNEALNIGCAPNDDITTAEFPYTSQNKEEADENASAWTLSSIDLPSGGKLEVHTESDDYQYVQNKKVMQMFNVVGAGSESIPQSQNIKKNLLYGTGTSGHVSHLYIKINDNSNFAVDDYIGQLSENPIQFRMLLNMTNNKSQYDYVTGYFELAKDASNNIDAHVFTDNGETYLSLPIAKLDRDGKIDDPDVNPISKAGWMFGRTYLNQETYSLGGESFVGKNFTSIVNELASSLGSILKIFNGPNKVLETKGCARIFNPKKSWVRLLNPTKRKLGGGLRVTKIEMHDNWDVMTSNLNNPLYKQFYGQEYNYNNEDGNTSGVATFEPASSKENPFIEPVYGNSDSKRDKLLAPKESNYVEKPFGESFFPSPTVTYGRVEVKNLQRERIDGSETFVVKKHATGKVVNEFYTSYDFPTITDYTDIEDKYVDMPTNLSNFLNISVKNKLTFSQGFVVETNDMNGKVKRQRVYGEEQSSAISGVDYNYSVNEDNTLNNKLPTINKQGAVSNNNLIGMHYDVVNDFRENYSKSETFGVNTNIATFLAAIFPVIVPVPLPKYALHEDVLRIATTTKVIHKTGILKEKVAYDLGAQVSTENIAWDADTGQVLLTKTVNEYDNAYYNFTYPAYWHYEGMGMASNNLGMEGILEPMDFGEASRFAVPEGYASEIFHLGDMLQTSVVGNEDDKQLLWVVEIPSDTDEEVKLMDAQGHIINEECSPFVKGVLRFKIIRSGYKNLQSASMASITTQINPIDIDNDGQYNPLSNSISKVVNASAVMYNDFWKPQDQLGLPRLTPMVLTEFNKATDNSTATNPNIDVTSYGFNPYLYNARGEWRAVESYAYLQGRTSSIVNAGDDNPNLSNDGYFSFFSPFYRLNTSNNWEIKASAWTSASTVTQYSPYGAELENKDALGRYSSAVYGYGYTLPTAVASNSEYKETAFVGFEDEDTNNVLKTNSAIIDENEAIFVRDHFSFNSLIEETQNNGTLTSETSHTGTKSFKVTGEQVGVTKGLMPNQHTIPSYCYSSDVQGGVVPLTYTTTEVFDNVIGSVAYLDQDDLTLTNLNTELKYTNTVEITYNPESQDDHIRVVAEAEIRTDGDGECFVMAQTQEDGTFVDETNQYSNAIYKFTRSTTIVFDNEGKCSFEFSFGYPVSNNLNQAEINLIFYFLDSVGRQRANPLKVIFYKN